MIARMEGEQKWRQRGGRQRRKLPTPTRCKPGSRGRHGPRMLATAIIQNATRCRYAPLSTAARLRKRPEISAAAFSFIMYGLSFVRYRVTDRPLIRRESPSTTAVFDVLWRHILSQG